MIGKFIDNHMQYAERVLSEMCIPGAYVKYGANLKVQRCLIGVMANRTVNDHESVVTLHFLSHQGTTHISYRRRRGDKDGRYIHANSVEGQFDMLCLRFGTERINRVIRQRIIRNKVNAELSAIPTLEVAHAALP